MTDTRDRDLRNLEDEASARVAKISADILKAPGRPILLRFARWWAKWCERKAREWRVDA